MRDLPSLSAVIASFTSVLTFTLSGVFGSNPNFVRPFGVEHGGLYTDDGVQQSFSSESPIGVRPVAVRSQSIGDAAGGVRVVSVVNPLDANVEYDAVCNVARAARIASLTGDVFFAIPFASSVASTVNNARCAARFFMEEDAFDAFGVERRGVDVPRPKATDVDRVRSFASSSPFAFAFRMTLGVVRRSVRAGMKNACSRRFAFFPLFKLKLRRMVCMEDTRCLRKRDLGEEIMITMSSILYSVHLKVIARRVVVVVVEPFGVV